jgi:hypothetical protein
MKTYSDTYLFKKYPDYNKQLMEFLMGADRIDKKSTAFENVAFDIKRRQVSNSITKVMESNNVVLGIAAKPLPKAFKTFVSSDIKTDKKPRAFIDVSECIIMKDGEYICKNTDWMISYVIDAMVAFIYRMQENKLINNQTVVKDGAAAFAQLFTYIVDRIYKISTVQSLRKRIMYISALYYQVCILGKDFNSKQYDSIKAIAMKIADIETRDAQIVDIQIDATCFTNVNTFVNNLTAIFKLKDFSVDMLVAKWMQFYGTGTVFALEYFPAFSAMLTDTYVGGYINNQLTIEKITSQHMVKFTKQVLQIGDGV